MKNGVDENGNPLENTVKIRTILTCKCQNGVCSKCYGANMATGEAGSGRRGCRNHCRTVHRRAGYTADHAYVPLPVVLPVTISHRVFLVSRSCFEARKPKGLAIITEFGRSCYNLSDTKKKRESHRYKRRDRRVQSLSDPLWFQNQSRVTDRCWRPATS